MTTQAVYMRSLSKKFSRKIHLKTHTGAALQLTIKFSRKINLKTHTGAAMQLTIVLIL